MGRMAATWSLRRGAIMLCAMLLLGACGTRLEEPEPANRVAAAAWREWRLFGGGSISYDGGRQFRRGINEQDEPAASRIGEYWRLVGRPEWNGRDTDRPWSGAFISWVMARAGVPAREFPPAGRHAAFLLAIDAAQAASRSPPFVLRDPERYMPKPGDLVCGGRAGNVMIILDRDQRRAAIDRFVEHCEVVIAVRDGGLRTIGGNVSDSVTLSVYPRDANGPGGGRSWMLIVENRKY